MRQLDNFLVDFEKARSKGCFGLLYCKVSPEKLHDLMLHAKDRSVKENIKMNIQLLNLFISVSFLDFP